MRAVARSQQIHGEKCGFGATSWSRRPCDWDRYKELKAAMHEAAFELIEIPHVRQSGKSSADIRMVVDALDLCWPALLTSRHAALRHPERMKMGS